jgi:hypothetical protein
MVGGSMSSASVSTACESHLCCGGREKHQRPAPQAFVPVRVSPRTRRLRQHPPPLLKQRSALGPCYLGQTWRCKATLQRRLRVPQKILTASNGTLLEPRQSSQLSEKRDARLGTLLCLGSEPRTLSSVFHVETTQCGSCSSKLLQYSTVQKVLVANSSSLSGPG